MKKYFKLSVCLSIIFLYGCTGQVKQRRNIVCLIDYSGTVSNETLSSYANVISNDVFQTLGESDKFLLMPIDEGAKTEAVLLSYYDLKEQSFSLQTDGVTHKQDSVQHRLSFFLTSKSDSINNQIIAQKNIRKKYTNYTDIINAIEQLPNKLDKNETISNWAKIWNELAGKTTYDVENIVIICSDMIHESKEFNFNQHPTYTKEEFDQIIDQLKSANRLPSLDGVTVFVHGRTGRNNLQTDNIEYFWKRYFNEAKANLKSYDYDTHYAILDYLKHKN